MLTRLIAKSLMTVVPEKGSAVVTLTPDSATPTTIQIYNAWLKPLNVTLSSYGGMNLQGDETIIKVPQHELNPNNDGREIRMRDRITIDGTSYRVLSSTMKTVRTVWECLCRKEMI